MVRDAEIGISINKGDFGSGWVRVHRVSPESERRWRFPRPWHRRLRSAALSRDPDSYERFAALLLDAIAEGGDDQKNGAPDEDLLYGWWLAYRAW